MGLGLIGSALLGGVGGAGEAMQANSLEEMKQDALTKREQMLAKMRGQEMRDRIDYEAQTKRREGDATKAENAKIFADAEKRSQASAGGIINQASATYSTDEGEQSVDSNVATAKKAPTDRQRGQALREAAGAAGNVELAREGDRQVEQARKDEIETRRLRESERRADREERGLTIKERLADVAQMRADDAARKTDAYLAKMAKGDSEKQSADEKKVRLTASALFGYDDSKDDSDPDNKVALGKAITFHAGGHDKTRDSRVMEMVKMLQNDPKNTTKSFDSILELAEKKVDELESRNTPSRGGVKPGVVQPTNPQPVGGKKPWERFQPGGN